MRKRRENPYERCTDIITKYMAFHIVYSETLSNSAYTAVLTKRVTNPKDFSKHKKEESGQYSQISQGITMDNIILERVNTNE